MPGMQRFEAYLEALRAKRAANASSGDGALPA